MSFSVNPPPQNRESVKKTISERRAERPEYDDRQDRLVTEIEDPSKLIPLLPTIGPNNNN